MFVLFGLGAVVNRVLVKKINRNQNFIKDEKNI